MNESEVYYYSKRHLRGAGLNVFGGEPPGGSDDLHRIELKHPDYVDLGSRGSRKFDLLAEFKGRILLIELKDAASKLGGDISKLDDTVQSEAWIGKLWDNMSERRLIGRLLPEYSRDEVISLRHDLFVKVLGAPEKTFNPPPGFLYLGVSSDEIVVRFDDFEPSGLADALSAALASS